MQGVGRRLEVSCIIGEVRDYTGIGSKSAGWRDGRKLVAVTGFTKPILDPRFLRRYRRKAKPEVISSDQSPLT